jgi:hypothetical protein
VAAHRRRRRARALTGTKFRRREVRSGPGPANFAVQGGRVRYIDDDVARSRDAIGLEDAFTGRFAEYAGVPAEVWDGYAVRFARELALRVSPDDRIRLRLAMRLRAAARLRPASAPHVERVLRALEALS